MSHEPAVGRSLPRKEGEEKVTGRRIYVDDLDLPELHGMLHGATIRSSVPRGRIKKIHFDPVVPWDEFTIVTAKDVPGKNYVALILNDQPYLADGVVNHPEEAVALIAHPDKHMLERGRSAVRVEVEPLPAVLTIEESLSRKSVIWGEDNAFKTIDIVKGDVEKAMRSAHQIVEGEYRTGAQEQLYIEPNGVIARFGSDLGVTVWASLQCPYYVHKALKPLFGLEDDKVRVVQIETGGGFGGKEEYPSMIAGHAALLAKKAGRPVKIIYDRAEDMVATTKRHPSRTRHRTALDKDGRIIGMDIEFILDGGAYATLSAVVLSRGAIHAAGPYECPNVRVRAIAVATNTPPHGAFRGFGAPQSIFALERHMNKVAKAAGLAPDRLRERHFLKRGEQTATTQVIKEDPDLDKLMERAFALSKYQEKLSECARHNATSARTRRGIGFATFMHGAGFTGSGERMLESEAGVDVTSAGVVRVLAASTEIGQGTNTVFAQIAADALKIPYEDVAVHQPDTSVVPNSGPTVASRTVMVVGKLVQNAAEGVKQLLSGAGLIGATYTRQQFKDACQAYLERHGTLKVIAKYKQPEGINWDDKTYLGDAYATYAWAAYLAEVTVDLDTGYVTVDDFTAVQEAGRIVNPILAEGQIEGGVAQGVGFAVYEKVVWRDGRMANGRMTNYIVPTAADAPRIKVDFVQKDSAFGPGRGAKGIGELPMDGAAPAIANAIEMATGHAVDHVPFMPEDFLCRS